MKTFIRIMIISMLVIFAAPVWSAPVLHSIKCEQGDTSDEQVDIIATEWLKAAKKVKGGENLRLRMNFPVAAGVNDFDVVMLMIAPSFAEWGEFTDNYAGSEAEAIDAKYADELACGNGALWETMLVD